MGTTNRDFVQRADGKFPTSSYMVLQQAWGPAIPADETDVEYMSFHIPTDGDYQVVEAYMFAKATSGSNAKTIELEDDGTDITAPVTVVTGVQTEIPLTASPTRLKGGSEVQVKVVTGATTTITGLSVTLVIRPYPLGEAGVAVD